MMDPESTCAGCGRWVNLGVVMAAMYTGLGRGYGATMGWMHLRCYDALKAEMSRVGADFSKPYTRAATPVVA